MPRRMRDLRFREQQEADRLAPHIRPVNEFVDELRRQGRGLVPYVAPWHGGVDARVLSVLRDPGPMASGQRGSGFLCIENDDATAERQAIGFEVAGLSPRDVLPWNAYPWYINRAPTAAELELGVGALLQLLDLLSIEVVLLQGAHAQDAWKRLARRSPGVARGLVVVSTIHPSRQALFARDPEVRRAREEHRDEAYRRVAGLLQPAP